MADTQEKTEQPTMKRLEEARNSGQVPYSKELTSAITFMLGLAVLKLAGEDLIHGLTTAMSRMLSLPTLLVETNHGPIAILQQHMESFLWLLMPVFAVAVFGTLGPGLCQIGINLAMKKLKPDPSKLSPLKGIKRLVSLNSAVQVLQAIFKMTIVGLVVWFTIVGALPALVNLSDRPLTESIRLMLELLFLLGWRVSAGLLLLGILDVMYKRWKLTKDLMMTKEDVKEERKKSEGDPRIKGKIREAQRKIILERMKNDVPSADVVVRNPTHFAIAIKYDREADEAPRVVAKGRGPVALMIIRIAEENGVEVVVNRPLARELYRTVRLGEIIPERLFRAVAEILAMVFRKRDEREKKKSA